MLLDDVGEITITNDGATILQLLEVRPPAFKTLRMSRKESCTGVLIDCPLQVEHPAAKILVELAGLQDSEVGDGTTSVVILAAELLKRASDLIK